MVGMTNLQSVVAKLQSVGWEAEVSPSVSEGENLECLVHEIAHNLILGDMTPKDMAGTARLIHTRSPAVWLRDEDEILATAVTIQTLEDYFGVKGTTQDDALWAVKGNIRDPKTASKAADMVVELLGTDRVKELSGEMFDYINSVGPTRVWG